MSKKKSTLENAVPYARRQDRWFYNEYVRRKDLQAKYGIVSHARLGLSSGDHEPIGLCLNIHVKLEDGFETGWKNKFYME